MSTPLGASSYVPDSDLVADYAVCIALELRQMLDDVAPDIAIATEAPDGQEVDMAIENELLSRLAALLSKPNLTVTDLTPDRIRTALGSSVALE